MLLRQAIEIKQAKGLTSLEQEGCIQRFEYTMELAWNTLKDYLEFQNIVLDKITPRSVILKAFETKIITEGDLWQQALDARNKMSHTYNASQFELVIDAIEQNYLRLLGNLHAQLKAELVEKA